MILVCLWDNNFLRSLLGKITYKDHADISITANVGSFLMIRDILLTKEIDVLLLDLELEGCKYLEVKSILKNFPKTKVNNFQ
jgi:hypothetical protein